MNGFHGEKVQLLTQKDRKGSRGPGSREASEMLKSYRELSIWQKETRRGAPQWPPIKGARAYGRPRTVLVQDRQARGVSYVTQTAS
jgi:hypothetical protein